MLITTEVASDEGNPVKQRADWYTRRWVSLTCRWDIAQWQVGSLLSGSHIPIVHRETRLRRMWLMSLPAMTSCHFSLFDWIELSHPEGQPYKVRLSGSERCVNAEGSRCTVSLRNLYTCHQISEDHDQLSHYWQQSGSLYQIPVSSHNYRK